MSLQKILHIISSSPSRENAKPSSLNPQSDKFSIDLNLRLGPSPPIQESEFRACDGGLNMAGKGSLPASVGVEKSSRHRETNGHHSTQTQGDGNDEEEEERRESGEEHYDLVDKRGTGENGDLVENESAWRKEGKSEGCLNLLVEAAKIVSGEFGEDAEEPRGETKTNGMGKSGESEREESWRMGNLYGEFGETSPVVRSKRGRTQVLPYRFRDSVLEPLKPLSRPSKRRFH